MNAPIDHENTTLLHLAANNTTPAVLHLLLCRGAQANWQNQDGLSALHVAAIWGNAPAVKQLLGNGADPIVADEEDMTPLDHALSQGECRPRPPRSYRRGHATSTACAGLCQIFGAA